MSELTLHHLPPSPNNVKVRLALGYKGIPYNSAPVELQDTERRRIVQLSGQPLTPILEHGDRVILDSAGILRYLEANFPNTPKLMFAERDRARELETLEVFTRRDLSRPISIVFGQATSGAEPDLEACREASAMLHELTADVERRLAAADCLMGDALKIPDVTAVPFVRLGMVPEEVAEGHPILRFFHDNLHLGEGRERTREWVRRVLAYDRQPAAVTATI